MFNTEELGLIEQSLCRESMRLDSKLKTITNETLKRHYNVKIAMLLTLVQKIDKSLDDSARKVDDDEATKWGEQWHSLKTIFSIL